MIDNNCVPTALDHGGNSHVCSPNCHQTSLAAYLDQYIQTIVHENQSIGPTKVRQRKTVHTLLTILAFTNNLAILRRSLKNGGGFKTRIFLIL